MEMIPIPPGSKGAEILDNIAKMPPGKPFSLATAGGQMLFLGTRLPAPIPPAPPKPAALPALSALDLLKTFVLPFAAAFGVNVTPFMNSYQGFGVLASTSKLPWRPAAAPSYDHVFVQVQKAQEARKRNPGKPPTVLKLGDTTVTVHDRLTLIGDVKLVGDVVVPAPPSLETKPGASPASATGLLPDAAKLAKVNELLNFAGEGAETYAKFFPHLAAQAETAGGIVDGLTIVTSGLGFVDAIQRKDSKALISCSLTLGAGAADLLGKISGQPTLSNVALLLRFSKTGWTLLSPSKIPTTT